MADDGVILVAYMQIVDRWDMRGRDLQRRWLHKGKSYWESSSRGCSSIIYAERNRGVEG